MSSIPLYIWLGLALAVLFMAFTEALMSVVKKELPDDFRAMGEPHLVWNNTPRTTLLFWRWFLSALKETGRFSPRVRILLWVVLVLAVLSLVWFVVGSLSVFIGAA